MSIDLHKKSLAAALDEVTGLIEERDRLESLVDKVSYRIVDLTQAIEALGSVCGIDARKEYSYLFADEIRPEIGFTDAIRKVLRKTPIEAYSAIGLRDKLVESGFNLDKYTNPMASIHTILKRLQNSGDVLPLEDEGRVYYCWEPGKVLLEKRQREQRKRLKAKKTNKKAAESSESKAATKK